jgi:tyrosyl-tRNA synthetase
MVRFMSSTSASSPDLYDLLRQRGFVQQVTDEAAVRAAFAAGPVTFYVGFDPTAPSLHVGSLVPLMAMAHLARAGHRPIGVLGGGTTLVGDPSGKSEMRQMMTKETIAENRRSIEPQVQRFLVGAGERAILVDNAEWLVPLSYLDFLRDIGRHFSVNRMLAAEAYKMRLEKGLSFIEFNYQLLQAYDFLVLYRQYGCTLQMGGDDQWGNILAGTDLVRRLEHTAVHGLTFPLLTTASGAKMGKTASGAVWLSADRTSPYDMFQYFVNVDDRDVEKLLRLLTFLPLDEIARLAALQGAEIREAKRVLAHAITTIVHSAEAADAAQAGAVAAFSDGQAAQNVPTHAVAESVLQVGIKLVDLLAECTLCPSRSAARRLVEQGGARLGEQKIGDLEHVVRIADVPDAGVLLHAGKKHVRRIVRKS